MVSCGQIIQKSVVGQTLGMSPAGDAFLVPLLKELQRHQHVVFACIHTDFGVLFFYMKLY